MSVVATPDRRVFLSYRREASWHLARLVRDGLTRAGFDVFMDVTGIDNGRFESVGLHEITTRSHFVVILQPGTAFGDRQPESDWVQREIVEAIDTGRNVVPIVADGYRLDMETLPARIADLASYNAVTVYTEYFDAAMERLRRFLATTPDAVRDGRERARPPSRDDNSAGDPVSATSPAASSDPVAGAATAGAAEEGPYPGSIHLTADGSVPMTHPIKVRTDSGRYYTPDSPYYLRTRADLYFVGPREAEAAGFTAWYFSAGGASREYPASVHAAPDDSGPPISHRVKAHIGSWRYHTPDSPYYLRTRADLYFVGPREAEAAGFTAWHARPGGAQ